MQTFNTFSQHLAHIGGRAVSYVLFVSAVLATLFFFEAVPFRFDTNTAQAWHCEAMTASPSEIEPGQSSTLSWKFANDSGITVTIDGVGTFNGVSGTADVSPTETTTYVAVAHKAGTNTTMQCSVTVKVTTPPPTPSCDDVDMHIDDQTLVWSHCPHMDTYEVTYCDGTTETVEGPWSGDVSLDLGKRIKEVTAQGGDCEKYASQTCPTPPEPETLSCSMSAAAASIHTGESTTLSWESSNVVAGSIDQGIGTVATSGSQSIAPTTTTTYTGTFTADDGRTTMCSATVEVAPVPEAPYCSLSVSPSSISKGASATLAWSGARLVSGSIDQGIGTVATSGSQSVSPTNTTTYTGTFATDDGGTTTCSATLTVRTSGGGGGACLNCDTTKKTVTGTHTSTPQEEEEKVTPSIVLAKTVTRAGSFITLDQVPYTGFEAGPVATTFFWLTVLAISALIAYLMTRYQPVMRLRAHYAVSHGGGLNPLLGALPVVQSGAASVAMRQMVPGIADADGAGMIEAAAHAENILLSPEATRVIMQATGGVADVDAFLAQLFARTVATYPREDGWILLSQERAQALLSSASAPTPAAPAAAPAPLAQTVSTSHESRPHRVETPRVNDMGTVFAQPVEPVRAAAPATQSTNAQNVDSIIPLFLDLVIAGEQRKSFDLLRRLTAQGVPHDTFIMAVVRKLDDVYKSRIEGNHNPDRELAAKTANWSNTDFEQVLSILVECVDYSYSSSTIGTKVALTKLFEHFAR